MLTGESRNIVHPVNQLLLFDHYRPLRCDHYCRRCLNLLLCSPLTHLQEAATLKLVVYTGNLKGKLTLFCLRTVASDREVPTLVTLTTNCPTASWMLLLNEATRSTKTNDMMHKRLITALLRTAITVSSYFGYKSSVRGAKSSSVQEKHRTCERAQLAD